MTGGATLAQFETPGQVRQYMGFLELHTGRTEYFSMGFISGFRPAAETSFTFLTVAGMSNFDLGLVNLVVGGLGDQGAFRFLTSASGQVSIVAAASPAPVPLPAAAWLLGAAMAGLGGLRLRSGRPALGAAAA